MSTALTSAQTRFLRGQAHDLKAMLQVGGKGITDALVAEIDLALEHHELIKVKVAAEDREARDAMIERNRRALRRGAGAAHRPHRGAVPPEQGQAADRAAARLSDAPAPPRRGRRTDRTPPCN